LVLAAIAKSSRIAVSSLECDEVQPKIFRIWNNPQWNQAEIHMEKIRAINQSLSNDRQMKNKKPKFIPEPCSPSPKNEDIKARNKKTNIPSKRDSLSPKTEKVTEEDNKSKKTKTDLPTKIEKVIDEDKKSKKTDLPTKIEKVDISSEQDNLFIKVEESGNKNNEPVIHDQELSLSKLQKQVIGCTCGYSGSNPSLVSSPKNDQSTSISGSIESLMNAEEINQEIKRVKLSYENSFYSLSKMSEKSEGDSLKKIIDLLDKAFTEKTQNLEMLEKRLKEIKNQ